MDTGIPGCVNVGHGRRVSFVAWTLVYLGVWMWLWSEFRGVDTGIPECVDVGRGHGGKKSI